MTAQEFFYWLQGFFEVSHASGLNSFLNAGAASCILKHIDLVPEDARGEGLIAVRTLVRLIAKGQPAGVAENMTREIEDTINEVFLHVIDPKAGGADEQAKLNAIHEQNPHLRPRPYTGGPVPRC